MNIIEIIREEHSRLCAEVYQQWRDLNPFSYNNDEKLYISIGRLLSIEYVLRIYHIDSEDLTEQWFKRYKGEDVAGCYNVIKSHR